MQKLLVPIEMLGYQRIYNLERKVQTYLNLYSYFTIKLGIVFYLSFSFNGDTEFVFFTINFIRTCVFFIRLFWIVYFQKLLDHSVK